MCKSRVVVALLSERGLDLLATEKTWDSMLGTLVQAAELAADGSLLFIPVFVGQVLMYTSMLLMCHVRPCQMLELPHPTKRNKTFKVLDEFALETLDRPLPDPSDPKHAKLAAAYRLLQTAKENGALTKQYDAACDCKGRLLHGPDQPRLDPAGSTRQSAVPETLSPARGTLRYIDIARMR